MAKVMISEKYLHDIANAIRAKLDSQSTYTPAQMAAAIEDITGSIAGSITPSTATAKVLVMDSSLAAIANVIRAKLDVATLYTPAQMADAILSIQSAGPTIVSWANGTDEEVAAMIDAAHAGTIDLQQDGGWAVGDVRTIRINAFTGGGNVAHPAQDVDIVITSFDEYMSCGNVMQFDFKDALESLNRAEREDFRYNTQYYPNGEMVKTTMPALLGAMPNWVNNRLIQFSVPSVYTEAGQQKIRYNDAKLALRSGREISESNFSEITNGEGTQLAYYSTSQNRIKKQGKNGSPCAYWTRTRYIYDQYKIYCVNESGGKTSYVVDTLQGIAPFGCL